MKEKVVSLRDNPRIRLTRVCLNRANEKRGFGHEIALDMAISQFAHTPKPHRGCRHNVRAHLSPPLFRNSIARGGSLFPRKRRYAQMQGAGAGLSAAICAPPRCGVRAPRNEFFAIVGKKTCPNARSTCVRPLLAQVIYNINDAFCNHFIAGSPCLRSAGNRLSKNPRTRIIAGPRALDRFCDQRFSYTLSMSPYASASSAER